MTNCSIVIDIAPPQNFGTSFCNTQLQLLGKPPRSSGFQTTAPPAFHLNTGSTRNKSPATTVHQRTRHHSSALPGSCPPHKQRIEQRSLRSPSALRNVSRGNSRFEHGSVSVHNIFAYFALSLSAAQVYMILQERCTKSTREHDTTAESPPPAVHHHTNNESSNDPCAPWAQQITTSVNQRYATMMK